MSKKTLISVACGLAAISCAAGLSTWKASASTTYSELLNDNFEASTTFNTENWNEVATESGASVELRANPNPFLQYDLTPGKSVATKDPITVADDECLIIEFKMNSISVSGSEFLSFVYGAEDTDLNDEAQSYGWCFLGDSMLGWGTSFTNNKYNADATLAPMWTAWNRSAAFQVYIHPDGSVELYQDLCMLISYVRAEDATDAMKDRNGHIGFTVTNAAASINLEYLKIGKCPESDFTAKDPTTQVPTLWFGCPASATWMLSDSNPTKNGLNDAFVSNDENIGAWRLGNNVLNVNENAAEVVSKAQIPAADARIGKVFEMTADWDVTGLGDATAEFAFGNAAAGIAKHDGKNYLTIWDGATVVAEEEVALGNGAVSVLGYGDGTIKATFNGKTVSGVVSSYEGAFAYNVTAGAANISLDNLKLEAAGAYEHKGGISHATDFSEVNEDHWYIGSTQAMAGMPQGGGVYVEDGQIVFMNAGDASMIATKESYTNFEFSFDLTYIEQEGQENDDGDITRAPSFFPGFSYNMDAENTFFGNGGSMIYFQKQTVDLFGDAKFADGTTRVWLTEAQDMYTQNAAGKVINFKFVAKDGTITTTITNKTDGVVMYEFQLFNQNTTGHVAVQTTGCGNFELDNMYIINLDEIADYQLTQKTLEKATHSIFEGTTFNGEIDLGDMTNKTAVFSTTDTVEGFTLNADGTYTYVAPAAAPAAPIVVNYTVAIDDFDLGFVKPVGDASKYTVNGQIEINVNAIVISSLEITAPTKVAYTTGEELDFAGLVVKAIYNDGHEETITEGYTVDSSAVNLEAAGEYTVTVSYEGVTATFKVTVEKASSFGCSGSMALGSMASVLALGAVAFVAKKSKKEN